VKGVAESGVRSGADARRLRAAGAVNLLVGEALVRAADPGALLRELCA
jgi:indole-3-glycerol phosphate synthase